jgi:hypothetical protein
MINPPKTSLAVTSHSAFIPLISKRSFPTTLDNPQHAPPKRANAVPFTFAFIFSFFPLFSHSALFYNRGGSLSKVTKEEKYYNPNEKISLFGNV